MSRSVLRLGTRKSPMAMAQAGHVAQLITARTGRQVELVGLTSFGDVTQVHLPDIGGTGVFVSALRESLLARRRRPGRALAQGPAHGAAARHHPRGRAGQGRPQGRAGRQGRRQAGRPAAGRDDRHRLAAPGCPAAADAAGYPPGAGPRQCRHPAGKGDLGGTGRGGARLRRTGPDRRARGVSEVFEPDAMIPAPGQGALAVECLRRRGRPGGPARRGGRPGQPRGRDGGARGARRARGRMQRAAWRLRSRDRHTAAHGGCHRGGWRDGRAGFDERPRRAGGQARPRGGR